MDRQLAWIQGEALFNVPHPEVWNSSYLRTSQVSASDPATPAPSTHISWSPTLVALPPQAPFLPLSFGGLLPSAAWLPQWLSWAWSPPPLAALPPSQPSPAPQPGTLSCPRFSPCGWPRWSPSWQQPCGITLAPRHPSCRSVSGSA